MRTIALTLAVLAGLGAAGGAAVVGMGLYNVSAQAGHLPGVSWVLHTTFRNSVALRAPDKSAVPPLEDPDLIALGAHHYASACATCHARPDAPRSATMRAMVPAPPPITEAITDWQPQELHWIIENGIKMSGMPAWPVAGRGDEIWSVVAYLEAVKSGTAPGFPAGEASQPDRSAQLPHPPAAGYCASCHLEAGDPVPRLDIQNAPYLEEQMRAYLSGRRPSGIMAQAMSVIPAREIPELARHLSRRAVDPALRGPAPGDPLADSELAARGATLAASGTRDVPACDACHGADAARPQSGAARGGDRGPVLAGQGRQYLAAQLRLWASGALDHDPLMSAAARDLAPAQIEALAAHYAARPAPQTTPEPAETD
ncbi:c-type cytochrome [Pseudooceanicola aestuarii]|uniref:c-type cytochrome n=1 Tax=Pseudooceanicola aestuarii TaxID=2697319 RepID=UPI0013D5DAC1|nr:c-type cytochrome [Pseudooceanicola aestuarii]